MKITRTRLTVAIVCCLLTFPAASAFGQDLSNDQIVEQARGSYYDLHKEGLKGFRCEVRVDWDAALRSLKMDEAVRERSLAVLRQMRFEAVVGPSGATEISHHFDGTPPNEQVAQGLRTTTDGVEQMLTGIFQQWSMFMFGPPLPNASDNFRVERENDHFGITIRSEPAVVVERLNKNYAIEEVIVATQHSTATMRPQFERGEKGYMPVVFDSTVEMAGSDKMVVHLEIVYQNTEGFYLPQTASVQTKQPTGDVKVQFSFADYQVTR